MAPKKILFSSVKNEGPFLLEWLAYHKAIGFDTFLIVSNDSDDGTTELLDSLAEAGEIHHIYHNVGPDQSPQGRAAALANESGIISDGDWVLWLDADEFLNIHVGSGLLCDLVNHIEPAHGILIPWRIFGDGGNKRFHGRFISAKFQNASELNFAPNATIKTLFLNTEGKTRLGERANHRPRLIDRSFYTALSFFSPNAQYLDTDFAIHARWLSGVEGAANFKISRAELSWEIAQINHYMIRTQDIFTLKEVRGRGYRQVKNGIVAQRPRHTPEFFERHNRNEEIDTTILRHLAATDFELERLMKTPSVAHAHCDTCNRTAARLADLESTHNMSTQNPIATIPPNADAPMPKETLTVPTLTFPDAEADLVREYYGKVASILEYGSGGSTILAAETPHDFVASVESDKAWAENLSAVLNRDFPDAPVNLHWADIGQTKAWGHPKNDKNWRNFHLYPTSVWDQPWFQHPDLVLIDGRFRVACFMTTALRITRPVTVLFDDYTPRKFYHWVENFFQPIECVGRMARFEITPMTLPPEKLSEFLKYFTDPQ